MNKKNKYLLGIAAGLIVFVGIALIVSNKHDSSPTGNTKDAQTATKSNKVEIKGYMFTPASIKVKVGTTVTWTNTDAVNHTVTADTNSTDAPSSMDIAQGKSYSFTFTKAGTFTYHCFPHPYMHGTVEVTE